MGLGAAGTAAAIGAAGSIGGAAIGAVGSKKGASQSSSTTTSTVPWGPQQTYIQDIMSRAQGLYNAQQNEGRPTFDLYAPLTDGQRTAMSLANGQAFNQWGAGGGLLSTGQNAVNALPGAQAGLTNFANGNFNPGNAGPLNAAGGNVPGSIGMANQGILSALDPNNQYSADKAIAAGSNYAGSQPVQDLINTGVRRIGQQLTDVTLPGQTAAASATGNLNSTRSAVAEALARRNAANTATDLTSQISNNAFNTGASNYLTGTNTNLNASLGAAGAATGLTNTGLAGATGANALNLSNLGLQQQGLSGLLSSINLGGSLTGQGASLGQGSVALAGQAGKLDQSDQQALLDQNKAQWEAAQQYPWLLLNNYSNLAANKSWGGSSDGGSTQSVPGNPWGGALGGALTGLGLTNGLMQGYGNGGSGGGSLSSAAGYGLGYMNSPFGAPAVGTSQMTPYWRGLMAGNSGTQ